MDSIYRELLMSYRGRAASDVFHALKFRYMQAKTLNTPPHVDTFAYRNSKRCVRAAYRVAFKSLDNLFAERDQKKDSDRSKPEKQKPEKQETEPPRRDGNKGTQRVKQPKKRIGS